MLFNVRAQPSTRDRTVLSYDFPAWPKTIVFSYAGASLQNGRKTDF